MAYGYRCHECRSQFTATRKRCPNCGTTGKHVDRDFCVDCGSTYHDSQRQRCPTCGSWDVARLEIRWERGDSPDHLSSSRDL